MRRTFSLLVVTLTVLLSAPTNLARAGMAGISKDAEQAMNAIDSEKIRATVKYLADDALEGRGTGQKGGDKAADWLGAQFKAYGLQPAGDNGTFFQKVGFYGITTDQQKTRFTFVPKSGPEMTLKFGDDFVASDQTHSEKSAIDGPIVYVGYGINAPEYKWDDYKGANVKGKVLLMLVNEPPSDDPNFFKGKALTYYGRWTYKYEEAARKGAVGVILIHKSDMASYPWEVVRNSNSGEKSYLKLEGPALKVASWVHLDVAKKLAAESLSYRTPERHSGFERNSFQGLESSFADSACRRIDDAKQGDSVIAIMDDLQIRDHVLDLGALIKRESTHYVILQLIAPHGFFEQS